MTLGSLFDGSGGFPLAALMCGITPVWASEIDPFCVSVTSKRFPHMKHLGDVKSINGGEIEPVNIITFGSPCQDLSVAGKRTGLGGRRSGLFTEAVRIIKEMREKSQTQQLMFLDLRKGYGTLTGALWETATALPGVPWTPNTGESPKEESVSFLSQILEANVPQKYYLSEKACRGILRRAAERGKELPPLLRAALEYRIMQQVSEAIQEQKQEI